MSRSDVQSTWVSHCKYFRFLQHVPHFMHLYVKQPNPLVSSHVVPLTFEVVPSSTYSFFFFNIFFMWTVFKVVIEFVIILLLFSVLFFWLQGMWYLSSLTRDWTLTPYTGRQSLNYWTTREIPAPLILFSGLHSFPGCWDYSQSLPLHFLLTSPLGSWGAKCFCEERPTVRSNVCIFLFQSWHYCSSHSFSSYYLLFWWW